MERLEINLLLFCHPVVSDSLRPHGLQHTRPPCPSPSPGVCPSSCPVHHWCHPAISFSDALFFCLQSFPASGKCNQIIVDKGAKTLLLFRRQVLSDSLQLNELQQARLPCPLPHNGKKKNLPNKSCWESWISTYNRIELDSSYTTHRNNSTWKKKTTQHG